MTSYDIHFTVRLSTNHVFQGISGGWRQLFLWLQDTNESDHFGIGIQALVMGTDFSWPGEWRGVYYMVEADEGD